MALDQEQSRQNAECKRNYVIAERRRNQVEAFYCGEH